METTVAIVYEAKKGGIHIKSGERWYSFPKLNLLQHRQQINESIVKIIYGVDRKFTKKEPDDVGKEIRRVRVEP